jgi:predicted small integral membrane protein
LAVLELRTPGGDPRVGVLGIETTRGDRLFISILGTVFIMLAWLGLYGTPLWGGLAIAIVWWVLVWKKV